ncbi:MAG: hypothetical protein K6T86_05365 [Pirellulales bacterium]|nr:hypothetical protein [Pirellulales bacterium]
MSSLAPRSRAARWTALGLALLILLPSLWGFGTKFAELVDLARGQGEGTFAVSPVVNYLLASLGFLLLFGWAAVNGMFHDVERPKLLLLEREQMLDAKE